MWRKIKYGLLYVGAGLVFAVSAFLYLNNIPVWQAFLLNNFSAAEIFSFVNQQQVVVGRVTAGQNLEQVKRKQRHQHSFKAVPLQAPIYLEDTIWTTEDSAQSVITFNDGSELEVAPLSMIKIKFQEETTALGITRVPVVQVVSGEIKAKAGQNSLRIQDNEGKISELPRANRGIIQAKRKIAEREARSFVPPTHLKPAPAQIIAQAIPEAPAPAIPTPPVEAKPVATTPVVQAPRPQPLKTSPVARPAPKPAPMVAQSVTVNPQRVAGITGLQSNKFSGEELKNFFVDLSWAAMHSVDSYRVVFYDRAGVQELANAVTQDNRYRLTQLFSGLQYYRVQGLKQQRVVATSDLQPLQFAFNAPELKNPARNTQLNSESKQFFFTWEKTNFTSGYVLEVSKNEQFTKVLRFESGQNFMQVPLNVGRYWWRVRSKNHEIVSVPSEAWTVEITP